MMSDTRKSLPTMFRDYDILDWISFAIQEAQDGNMDELDQALDFVEELREDAE
jgi:hypothetical protein